MSAEVDESDDIAGLEELMRAGVGSEAHDSQDGRTRRTRRALAATAIVLAVLLATAGGYVGWALNAPVGAPVADYQTPRATTPAAAELRLPATAVSAISVAGADEYLGAEADRIWATTGSDESRSIASISKLVTALVVLEAHPLADDTDPGPTITFTKADHDLYDRYYVRGATIAAMPTGSSMSLRDALATMLLPSACNYAEAVSTWAYGSQWAFLRATRAWLAAHELTGTTIVEPTGLDPRNTSTPSDLIAIGRLAAANPAIARIAATPSLSLPGPGNIVNTNSLLGIEGITGLKTGNLGPGRFGLLYTASLEVGAAEPLSVFGVMLDGYSRDSVDGDVTALLGSIRDGFHDVAVASRGQAVGSYTTPWGESARIVVARDATLFTWSDTPITATMELTTPPDYREGETTGTITWTAGPNTTTVDVVLEETIEPPTEWWRLTHPTELGGTEPPGT